MTTPERLSAEALATYAAWTRDAKATGLIAEINQYGPSYLEIGMLAREVQASRRLAPLHAVAVAVGDAYLRLADTGEYDINLAHEGSLTAAYRSARASAQPELEDEAASKTTPFSVADALYTAVGGLGTHQRNDVLAAVMELTALIDERIRAALRERGA